MTLIEKTLNILGKESHGADGLNIVTLTQEVPNAINVLADLLQVQSVLSKVDFEEKYLASYEKEINESDDEYQQRLIRLNESKLIPAINRTTEKKILFCIDPTSEELDKFCNWEYGLLSLSTYKDITGLNSSLSLMFDENEEMPVFIRKLFKYCHDEKATDIDITTMQSSLSIKLKISGEWTDPIGTLPITYKNKFLIALGSLSSPNPTDYKSGKELKFRVGQEIDGINILFRVAVYPTTFGENIVIRKLPTIGSLPQLSNLGLSEEAINYLNKIVKLIESPKKGGMVLITGETGSGKSTLLSAVISEYLKLNKKVNTSEDPVENKHPHPFLNQTEVGEDSGLSHMDALAGFLRLNSDVIIIGECRRAEEFLAVINASLSGHFTYTTYHTGSVPDTLLRLTAMGIDLSLIAGTLKGIVSASLIPRLCSSCKVPTDNGRYLRNKLPTCPTCKGRGINGVVPVVEASFFNNEIKKLIGTASFETIVEAIVEQPNYISMSSQIIRLKELGIIDNEVQDVL